MYAAKKIKLFCWTGRKPAPRKITMQLTAARHKDKPLPGGERKQLTLHAIDNTRTGDHFTFIYACLQFLKCGWHHNRLTPGCQQLLDGAIWGKMESLGVILYYCVQCFKINYRINIWSGPFYPTFFPPKEMPFPLAHAQSRHDHKHDQFEK